MDYIRELRQVVGNRPLIMAGAALLLLNPERQLLMMRRTDNQRWGIPGGAMELGESLEDTARRETQEEIGVWVPQAALFGVYSGPELYYQYPNGAEVYNVTAVYIARGVTADIQLNPEEHSEYQFFDLSNLPAEISPPVRPILRDLVQCEGPGLARG